MAMERGRPLHLSGRRGDGAEMGRQEWATGKARSDMGEEQTNAADKAAKDRELRMWCLSITGGDIYRAERAYMWVTGREPPATREEYGGAEEPTGIHGADVQPARAFAVDEGGRGL